MIAFLSPSEMGSDCSPVSRVRSHLRTLKERGTSPSDPSVRRDLRTVMARLKKLQRRGGKLCSVELSGHLENAVRSLGVVGNEMLVLLPERRGA